MNTLILQAEPLSKEAFAPFGDVIESEGATHYAINAGTVERYHDLAKVEIDSNEGGRPIVSLAQINEAKSFPFRFNIVERHPKGSQAFIPMFKAPVAIVVGPKGETLDAKDLRAFVTNGKQGFNYHAGIWHMPLMSSVKGGVFVVVDRAGPGNNCDEIILSNTTIELRVK